MVGAGWITEEDGSLKEVGAAERLVKDWTGVGGVCLASLLETYRQIKISHGRFDCLETHELHTHTCMYMYKGV